MHISDSKKTVSKHTGSHMSMNMNYSHGVTQTKSGKCAGISLIIRRQDLIY